MNEMRAASKSAPSSSTAREPRAALWFATWLCPTWMRDELLGDLREEFELRSTASVSDARAWYQRQVVRSAPALVRARLMHGGALGPWRLIGVIVLLALSALQAWDSNAFAAPPYVFALVVLGSLFVPAAVLLQAGAGTTMACVALSLLVLWTARGLSPVHHPELALIAVFGFLTSMLLRCVLEAQRRTRSAERKSTG